MKIKKCPNPECNAELSSYSQTTWHHFNPPRTVTFVFCPCCNLCGPVVFGEVKYTKIKDEAVRLWNLLPRLED